MKNINLVRVAAVAKKSGMTGLNLLLRTAVRPGRLCSMVWRSAVKVSAKGTKQLEAVGIKAVWKYTMGTVRLGVEYANIKSVIEARAAGEGNGGALPANMRWEVYPYLLVNQDGQKYLRVTRSSNEFHRVHVAYIVETSSGKFKQTTKEWLIANGVAASSVAPRYNPDKKPEPIFNIKVENLIALAYNK